MRKKIIAGNWKMNKTPSEAVKLIEELKSFVSFASSFLNLPFHNCPIKNPFPFKYRVWASIARPCLHYICVIG